MTFAFTEIADCILESTIPGKVIFFTMLVADIISLFLASSNRRFAWQLVVSTHLVYNPDFVLNAVSFAAWAASLVSMAIWNVWVNNSMSLYTLKRAFRIALLLTEQASSKAGVCNLWSVGQKCSRGWNFVAHGKVQILKQALRFGKCIANPLWGAEPQKMICVKLVHHESFNFFHHQIVDSPWRRTLSCKLQSLPKSCRL